MRSVTTILTVAVASILGAVLPLATASASIITPVSGTTHSVFYVSPDGNGTSGLSWATAWRDTSRIDWSVIPPGSYVMIDGGKSTCGVSPYDFKSSSPNPGITCGQRYSPFSVGRDNVTIERSTAVGHNGTVVVDGGRDTALPYCAQASYSAPGGAAVGIDLNGHSGVVINGMTRSGIVVRGAKNGVRMGAAGHDLLRDLEIFDNGYAISHSWGYSTDGNGILMGGRDNGYGRLLIHDNGQDEFHSDSAGYDESGSWVSNSWMGAMREHPSYPGEPFNDLQASGHNPGCTHADGIQIFAPPTTMSGLNINHDVFGPGINQGLYPSDSGTGATVNDVTIINSLFLDAASHNVITDNPVHGWDLDHDTIFATQGGFEIPGNGGNTMTNVIKYGGYVYTPGGSWTTSGNTWYLGDPLPGGAANLNPGFASVPNGKLPSLASLRGASLTASATTSGSPLHSWSALLTHIDSLNR